MSSIDKTYTNASKKQLASRISRISNKSHLKALFSITYNATNNYTKTSDGVVINLHILNSETLAEIEDFLDLHYPLVTNKPISEGLSSYCSDSNSGTNKLTNKEVQLMKHMDSKRNTSDSSSVRITSKISVKPFV